MNGYKHPDSYWNLSISAQHNRASVDTLRQRQGGLCQSGFSMFQKVIVFLFLIGLSIISSAQITFQKVYNGIYSSGETPYSLKQTNDGGFIIATAYKGSGASDAYLIKTNYLGDTLWCRTYGGVNNDYASIVIETNDSGYVFAGSSYFSAGVPNYRMYVVKTNSNGDTLWTRAYHRQISSYKNIAKSIKQTMDGGYIIAGISSNAINSSSGNDIWIVKIDSVGNTLWSKIYDLTGYDEVGSIQQTYDGGYILTGSLGISGNAFYLLKTDSAGATLWLKYFEAPAYQYSYSVLQTTDSGYIMCGSTNAFVLNFLTHPFLIKTNSSGDTLWTKWYDTPINVLNVIAHVNKTYDGGFIIGTTMIAGSYAYNIGLIKTDSAGEPLWVKTYGGTNYEYGYDILQTQDSGYAAVGYTTNGTPFQYPFFVKINANGNSNCTEMFIPFASATAPFNIKDTIFNSSSGVLTSPVTTILGSHGIDSTLCFSFGINDTPAMDHFLMYPNPSSTVLNIQLPTTQTAKQIVAYDMQGRQVLRSDEVNTYPLQLDVSGLTKGVYIVRVVCSNSVFNARVVIE